MQCVTRRVRQVEPEIHVPCRLPFGAQICTKNGGRPDLKLTLFLVEKGCGSIAFFTCSLADAQANMDCTRNCSVLQNTCGGSHRKSMYHAGFSVGGCPKLHQKWGPDRI